MRDQPDDLSPKERCLLAQLKEQHRQHAQQPGENADVVCTVSTERDNRAKGRMALLFLGSNDAELYVRKQSLAIVD